MGVLREADASYYMREEAGGLLLGPYEKGAPCCYVDGPSPEAEYELFQEDLDRLGPHIDAAIARVPAFGEVGIKKVYNGAIAYTPDGGPIIGPAWGLKNFWLNEGHTFGVTAAGGAGWQLAEWMVEGEPRIDMMGVDPAPLRPLRHAGLPRAKNEEAYAKVFTPHYPDEERAAGAPAEDSALLRPHEGLGAVFGSVYGWERPNWFAPRATGSTQPLTKPDVLAEREPRPGPTGTARSRRPGASAAPTISSTSATSAGNVTEQSGCRTCRPSPRRWSGPGRAGNGSTRILANRIPKTRGRIALCHLLTANGGVRAEFTVYERAPERVLPRLRRRLRAP